MRWTCHTSGKKFEIGEVGKFGDPIRDTPLQRRDAFSFEFAIRRFIIRWNSRETLHGENVARCRVRLNERLPFRAVFTVRFDTGIASSIFDFEPSRQNLRGCKVSNSQP